MSVYSIKQLELVSGIKAHTIRMWEKRYGLFSPNRTDTNIRRYTDTDVQLILNISLLTRNGFRISKVANRSLDEISGLILQQVNQNSSYEKSNLEPLIQSMLAFDQKSFKSYLGKSIKEQGLEKSFEDLISPMLHRIGVLWQTGMLNSIHEHFISNIIKHAIIYNTEILNEPDDNAPLIMYFLPDGEFHEIGLLFWTYIGKKMGFRTLYLGQTTPLEDIAKTGKTLKPSALFTSISTTISNSDYIDSLKKLQKDIPKTPLFVAGYRANQDRNNLPKSFNVVSSVESFTKKIASLKTQ